MASSSKLPDAFRKQIIDKVSDIQKDVKMWNGLRTNFSIQLQGWDSTTSANEGNTSERLFPTKVDTSAEVAMEIREQIRAELEAIFPKFDRLNAHIDSSFSELKQEIGKCLSTCHK